jgi:hypothetical protein
LAVKHGDAFERLTRALPKQAAMEIYIEDAETAHSVECSGETRLKTLDSGWTVSGEGDLEVGEALIQALVQFHFHTLDKCVDGVREVRVTQERGSLAKYLILVV